MQFPLHVLLILSGTQYIYWYLCISGSVGGGRDPGRIGVHGVMEEEETGASLPHFALDISGVSDHLFRAFHPEAEALIDRRGVFTLGNTRNSLHA